MDPATAPTVELERLYAEHYRRLVTVLTVAAGDRAHAEDAVQEAFAQALVHWKRIRTYDEPLAWLRRVALNRILNQRRSLRRRDAAVEQLRVVRDDAVDASGAHGVRIDLANAIASLPLQQRTAVALFYLDDLPSSEVATAMGITDGAVRYHLHAAREALTPLLETT